MNSLGQILLVICAMTIFSMVQLSVNASILQSFVVSIDSEASLDALSLGQSMIDEVTKKSFDKVTLEERIYNRAELTPVNSFGPDSGEVIVSPEEEPYSSSAVFDDIDDYHGYTRIVSTPRLGDFTLSDSVYYLNEENQDLTSNSQTWYKEVVVTVTNANLSDPVKVRSLTVYRRFF